MARRGGEYLVARRVADRGNDISIFYSRARGEDRRPTRRVADQGSDGVYHDPRDLKEIKRLRQRVLDLEIKQEIKRLRQRVRDLEFQRERRVMKTESGPIVRDDVNEEEENSFMRHPPWFYETIYPEGVSEDKPRFDEDGIGFDEEEFRFVQAVLGGNTIFENEPKKEIYGKVPVIVDEFFVGKKAIHEAMVAGDDLVVGDDESHMETPTTNPIVMEDLHISSLKMEYPILVKIQIEEIIGEFKIGVDIQKDEYMCEHDMVGPKVDDDHYMNFEELHRVVINFYGPTQITPIVEDEVILGWSHGTDAYVKVQKLNGQFNFNNYLPNQGAKDMESNNGPFDPGGTGLKLGKTTHEAKLFRKLVKIMITGNRIDVPFDPGGFSSKAKLEDEFFSKTGSMMQDYLLISLNIALSFI